MNKQPLNYDPVAAVLGLLPDARPTGEGKWEGRCPAHDDAKASLSIARGDDGRALLHCFAGCTPEAVCKALGLQLADLFPPKAGDATPPPRGGSKGKIVKRYPYQDEAGTLLNEVCRYEPKGFRQRRPDGKGGWTWNLNGVRRVLFRLPELLAADPAEWVFLAEGEKDVENLRELGLVATTNPGGAGKWRDEYAEALRVRRVAILWDKDRPNEKGKVTGLEHARDVARRLTGIAAEVRIVNLDGDGKDVSDWIEAHDAQDPAALAAVLVAMAEAAPVFDPAETPPAHVPDADEAEAVLVCMADVEAKPLTWLWLGRIPSGKLALLAGDPERGKQLGHRGHGRPRVERDALAGRQRRTPRAGDGHPAFCRRRPGGYDQAAPDGGRGDHGACACPDDREASERAAGPVLPGSGLARVERAIREHPDVRLIVIDPVSAYLGRADSHVNAEVRGILAPLTDLAARSAWPSSWSRTWPRAWAARPCIGPSGPSASRPWRGRPGSSSPTRTTPTGG